MKLLLILFLLCMTIGCTEQESEIEENSLPYFSAGVGSAWQCPANLEELDLERLTIQLGFINFYIIEAKVWIELGEINDEARMVNIGTAQLKHFIECKELIEARIETLIVE